MKVKYTAFLSEARGSEAGTVASRNTYGSYFRQKVTPVNPSSQPQQLVRQLLASVAQAWRGITENQRKLWNLSSDNFSVTDIFGDQITLTGFNLFGRLNRNLQTINEATLTDAPQPVAVTGFTSLSVVADTTGGTLNATFTPAIVADVKVVVAATAPQSAGKSFVKSEYRKIKIGDIGDLSPFDLAAAYIVVFGGLPPVGSKVFIRFKPVQFPTGLDGTEISASDIAI